MTSFTRRTRVIDRSGLDTLLADLRADGYTVLGPHEEGAAIRTATVKSTRDLPEGVGDEQGPGHYRLHHHCDDRDVQDPSGATQRPLFAHGPGPDSWKRQFFPPERQVWALRLRDGVFAPVASPEDDAKYALLGVRACDLHALQIHDRVFLEQRFHDEDYARRREAAFIVAVNCSGAAATCFCDAMGTGPRCDAGFDLALTELIDAAGHRFLVDVGSDAGLKRLDRLAAAAASSADIELARAAPERAREQQSRSPPPVDLPALLARNPEHPRWAETGARCLACGNCTLVCPTCFCSDFEDTADLTGSVAERRQRWSSCFNASFSYTHGGSIRGSTAARYRQWLTHKFSAWVEQFGTSGCVGCGRCITWCPVGIDVTEELTALAARDGEGQAAQGAPGEVGVHGGQRERA